MAKFMLWGGLTGLAIYVICRAILDHSLSAEACLELARYENEKLADCWSRDCVLDLLISRPQASDATMALTISLIEALGLYMLIGEGFELVNLAGHRAERARVVRLAVSGHAQAEMRFAAAAVREMTRTMVWSVLVMLLGVGLVYVAHLDMGIFCTSPFIGADQEQGHRFASKLAQWGGWGYFVFTAVGCLTIKLCFRKLGDQFILLLSQIQR